MPSFCRVLPISLLCKVDTAPNLCEPQRGISEWTEIFTCCVRIDATDFFTGQPKRPISQNLARFPSTIYQPRLSNCIRVHSRPTSLVSLKTHQIVLTPILLPRIWVVAGCFRRVAFAALLCLQGNSGTIVHCKPNLAIVQPLHRRAILQHLNRQCPDASAEHRRRRFLVGCSQASKHARPVSVP